MEVLQEKTRAIVKKRKRNYFDFILQRFTGGEPKDFYKNVNCLLGETTKRWSPKELHPECDEDEVAERLAAFFNDISAQYTPLDPTDLPACHGSREKITITEQDVAEKMKKSKKKQSQVPGDINCRLYDIYPDLLAVPVTDIYRTIIDQMSWPDLWKRKYVTVIPKKPSPQEASECRNISCTNYLSKLFESFVLEWARTEVVPKLNQYLSLIHI